MSKPSKYSRLKRQVYSIPDYIMGALKKDDLINEYLQRPAYQQNDYIGWITRAKKEETRQKRLTQMIEELKSGNKYMKMDYRPKRIK